MIVKGIVVAIQNKNREALGTSRDSVFQTSGISGHTRKRLSKILVISENSTDIYMIKKLLLKSDGYIIHEAATLPAALKVINYISIDLVLVDDMFSIIDGYEIVEKLNHIESTKNIPKIILLTTDYKTEKKESFSCENLDFVKKPLDSVIFKLRVKSLIKNRDKKEDRKSYFKHLAQEKFLEAQAEMAIYQEIFETSDNIMCIYDKDSDEVVESNAIFEKFFLNLNSFNRIMATPLLARKFVPVIDEANYLNYYDPKEWMHTLITGEGFTYLIKLHRDFKEYSFNIFVKKIALKNKDLYLIKLSNVYDYLPQNKHAKVDSKLQLKEKNFDVFKDDFLALRNELGYHKNVNPKIEKLLYQLSSKLSIVCEDASIVRDFGQAKEFNVYFTIVQLLKDKFFNQNIYINGKKVDKMLDENGETLYLDLNVDALYDLVFGLLNHYYGNDFSTGKQKRLDISVYTQNSALMIKIKLEALVEDDIKESFVNKIFNKNTKVTPEEISDMLPKNVKQSLALLEADIKKEEETNSSSFIITIDLD